MSRFKNWYDEHLWMFHHERREILTFESPVVS